MGFSSWALVPLMPIILWLVTTMFTSTFPTLRGKRIVLLIAHPDDEAMFFSPSVVSLTQPLLGNHVKILCLSTGNAEGLGETRRRELAKSGTILGLRGESDVLVLDDSRFPDSMTRSWPEEAIAELLASTFAPDVAKTRKGEQPKATVDVLVTFDESGVSGHPNHVSLYHGARAFIRRMAEGREGWEQPVKLYTLPSVSMMRKYASILDVPVTVVMNLFRKNTAGGFPDPLLSISGPAGYRKGQRAMTEAHQSQMRWFRWGWIGISRYMILNELHREVVR